MGSVLKYFKRLMATLGLATLAACGSGGGGSDSLGLPPAPTISTQPAAAAAVEGQSASFSVVATGSGLVYQWRRNGANVTGAIASTYTLVPALGDDGARFSVVVANTGGTVTSSEASLAVTPAAIAPTIATQPANATVSDGAVATFQVTASGTAPFTYRWLKNGVTIAGAEAASYSTPAVEMADSGATFSVVVTNSRGSVTSSAATLTVQAVAATVGRGPEPAAVVAGNPVTFSVFASGTAPFTYQWLRAGVAIPGATQSTYTFTTAMGDDGTAFAATVTNSAGTATSAPAVLSVFAAPQAITILSQPLDVTVRDGERPTFTVLLSGTGPFSVQWIRNGVDLPLTRLDNVSSTQYSFSLVRATIADDNGALYSLRITNAFGSVTTRQALLTVIP